MQVSPPDPLDADTHAQADADRAPEPYLESLGTYFDPWHEIDFEAFRVRRKRGDRE